MSAKQTKSGKDEPKANPPKPKGTPKVNQSKKSGPKVQKLEPGKDLPGSMLTSDGEGVSIHLIGDGEKNSYHIHRPVGKTQNLHPNHWIFSDSADYKRLLANKTDMVEAEYLEREKAFVESSFVETTDFQLVQAQTDALRKMTDILKPLEAERFKIVGDELPVVTFTSDDVDGKFAINFNGVMVTTNREVTHVVTGYNKSKLPLSQGEADEERKKLLINAKTGYKNNDVTYLKAVKDKNADLMRELVEKVTISKKNEKLLVIRQDAFPKYGILSEMDKFLKPMEQVFRSAFRTLHPRKFVTSYGKERYQKPYAKTSTSSGLKSILMNFLENTNLIGADPFSDTQPKNNPLYMKKKSGELVLLMEAFMKASTPDGEVKLAPLIDVFINLIEDYVDDKASLETIKEKLPLPKKRYKIVDATGKVVPRTVTNTPVQK